MADTFVPYPSVRCRILPFVLGLMLVFLGGCSRAHDSRSLTVMTYNIRYDNPEDGDNAWIYRKDRVANVFLTIEPDVAGLQEVLRSQLDTLAMNLLDYQWTGVGRADGLQGGEYSPIFYRADRFLLEDGGTFWLSENPGLAGSTGWDAALPRIVSWARLRDVRFDRTLYVFNTHFDHVGTEARQESARLLRREIVRLSGDSPFVVTGDFNTTPADSAYAILTDPTFEKPLLDARLSSADSLSPTFRGFHPGTETGSLIDYVFLGPDYRPLSYRIDDSEANGSYASDHLPVIVRFGIE
jgi:endonuclease/exonuclease/phosphatase family metal-dependent hydrolase